MTAADSPHHLPETLERLLSPLLTLSLPVLLLATAIRVEMNSLGLYRRGFRLYDVSQATGLGEDTLADSATSLILYFNSLLKTPQMTVTNAAGTQFQLFQNHELIHLADVRALFAINSVTQSLCLVLVAALVAAGLSFGKQDETFSALRRGAIVTLILLALSATAFFADFSLAFTAFHFLAFDNLFWLLDPLQDYLVMLFPLGFWQDMLLSAGLATGISAVALFSLSAKATRLYHSPDIPISRSKPNRRDV